MKENEQTTKIQNDLKKMTKMYRLAINDLSNVLATINEEFAIYECVKYCNRDGINCFLPSENNPYKCKNFIWRYENVI